MVQLTYDRKICNFCQALEAAVQRSASHHAPGSICLRAGLFKGFQEILLQPFSHLKVTNSVRKSFVIGQEVTVLNCKRGDVH